MEDKVAAYLEIAGKTCLLTVDKDTTLSGQCTDIPMGTYSYTLKYRNLDTRAILATAEGTITLEPGKNTEISFPPLVPYPFEAVTYYKVGEGPTALALGDLNNDGIPDVVTANRGANSVSVLLGKDNGTLNEARDYSMGPGAPVQHYPDGVALGDLNGDKNLDVVVISSDPNSNYAGNLAVFLGNGDGTLKDAVFYAIGDQPVSVAMGDLDGDGLQDVVTANYGSEDITILLGSKSNQLQMKGSYKLGKVNSVALGDLNGDGHLDVIASIIFSQGVVVLLGNGDGTFQTPLAYTTGMINSMALGDVNKDNNLDLIVSIYASQNVAVFLGKGDGTFQTGQFYTAGKSPESIALGDLDLDRNLDIVTENSGDEVVVALPGNGDGTFKTANFYELGNSPASEPLSIALEDLNIDGRPDVFSTNYDKGAVAVLIHR